MEWEEARAEFFQETYPSDRSISDSIGGLTTTSSSRRTVIESGTADSRRSRSNAPLIPKKHSVTRQTSEVNNSSTYGSQRSVSHGGPTRTTRLPTAASTTTVEVASSSTPEEAEDEADETPIVPMSPIPTVSSKTRRTSRGTRLRMRANVQGLEEGDSDVDIEIVDFADENLQTEVEVWNDLNKLKHLPIPLSQKKSLRLQYQKRPKIKLNRAFAFRFALKKFGHSVSSGWSKLVYGFHKLSQPILAIDKHRGSEMFATLSLHRLAIILAFLMSVNILLLLAVPYVFYICDDIVTCDELRSDNVTKVVKVDADNYVDGFFQNLKLPMKLEQSDRSFGSSLHYQLPFFYGYYRLGVISDASIVSKKVYKNVEQGSLYQNNFFADSSATYDYAFADEDDDTKSGAMDELSIMRDIYRRHLALIYVCVVFVSVVGLAIYFFRQFIWLVKGVIYDQTADTWFKNVFSSWSYCVVCKTSSLLKHQSIYKHVKQKIRMSKSVRETFSIKILAGTARAVCACLTLAMWTLIIFGGHFVCTLKSGKVQALLAEHDVHLSEDSLEDLQRALMFLPALLVTFVKLVTPSIASMFERWEQYPFTTKVAVYSGRLFFARSLALLAIVTTMFHNAVTSSSNSVACWEDKFCLQLVVLAAFDFMADLFLTFFVRLPRVAVRSIVNHSWNCTTKLTYDPYESLIDVVCDLSLMSAGVLYCPIISIVVLSKLCLTYPLKLFHIWLNCSASRDIHSASCIRFLFVGFSSVIIVFSVVSLVFSLMFLPTSGHCGPFIRQQHIADVFVKELDGLPSVSDISKSTTTTYILVCSILVLVFGLYISHLKRLSIEKTSNDLRCQLAIATQEKCYLISKMKRAKPSRSLPSGSKACQSNNTYTTT